MRGASSSRARARASPSPAMQPPGAAHRTGASRSDSRPIRTAHRPMARARPASGAQQRLYRPDESRIERTRLARIDIDELALRPDQIFVEVPARTRRLARHLGNPFVKGMRGLAG